MAQYGRGSFDGFASYQSGGSGRGDTPAHSDGGGNEMNRLSGLVAGNIQKITQNVALIQKLVGQIGTPQDSDEVRNRVHQTTHYTNQLAKETNGHLKAFCHLTPPASEQRQFKMQRERLTDEFSNVLKSFQTIQRTAAEKEKASVARARAHSGIESTPYRDEPTDEQMITPGFSQTRQVLQMEQDVDLELIKERENAIKNLEKDIMDVNQIFKDLGMLVHEQGEVLDSIEANIENAQISVSEGTQQLSKARDYQSKARRKKCCILMFVLAALVVVAIIITISVVTSQKK